MTRRLSYSEWVSRFGVPQLHAEFRNDVEPPDWRRSQFSITSATPEEARAAGSGPPQQGERLWRLSKLVGVEPLRLCSLAFVIAEARVPVLNKASDRQLRWMWEQLIAAGVRPAIVEH